MRADTTLPAATRLQRAIEATWPPARAWREGPWTFRDGAGGGKRVSAATAEGPVDSGDVARALSAFRAQGAIPLFQVRDGDAGLDPLLDAAGLSLIDPVTLYAAAVAPIARPGAVTVASGRAPTDGQRALWLRCGIGPGRIAVMARVPEPSACLSLPEGDHPTGVLFAACDADLAMIHALEVAPDVRRQGLGRHLIRAAAAWATDRGARHLGLVVLSANAPARALYASLGMAAVGQYHYRTEVP